MMHISTNDHRHPELSPTVDLQVEFAYLSPRITSPRRNFPVFRLFKTINLLPNNINESSFKFNARLILLSISFLSDLRIISNFRSCYEIPMFVDEVAKRIMLTKSLLRGYLHKS